MTTQQHTPGPWKCDEVYSPERRQMQLSAYISSNGEIVASAHYGSLTEEERMANARLIAAAPEMLEEIHSLRVMVEILLFDFRNGRDDRESVVSVAAGFDELVARALIQKIEGGAR